MHLALLMRAEVGVALKKLCAFLAVVLAQAGQVLYGLLILEGGEMLFVAQVGVDLVEVAGMAASLFLRVLSAYGWHGACVCGIVAVCRAVLIRGRRLSVREWLSAMGRVGSVGTGAARGPCGSLQVRKSCGAMPDAGQANATVAPKAKFAACAGLGVKVLARKCRAPAWLCAVVACGAMARRQSAPRELGAGSLCRRRI